MNHRTLPRLKHLAAGLALASSALLAGCASRLPADDASQTPVLDLRMFLVDPQVMINRAVMSKFGIRVGEVLLSFQRLPA